MLYLNKLWDDRNKMKPFWWIYLFQNKMKPLWQNSFLKTQADIYACSNYFFQGFFLFKLIWLHYGSVKAGTRFFPFLFSFFHPSIAWFLFYILVFHFLSFYCMFYLELCSHFLFFIFVLVVHFLWLQLINNVSLASFDNVCLASLNNVSLATISFFTLCQQSSLAFRNIFQNRGFFLWLWLVHWSNLNKGY